MQGNARACRPARTAWRGAQPGRTDWPRPRRTPMSQTAQLKVRVDRARCQGHARCNALAPELFDLDDLGNAREIGDGRVPAGLEDKAWLARANCPELAIEVIEEQDG